MYSILEVRYDDNVFEVVDIIKTSISLVGVVGNLTIHHLTQVPSPTNTQSKKVNMNVVSNAQSTLTQLQNQLLKMHYFQKIQSTQSLVTLHHFQMQFTP